MLRCQPASEVESERQKGRRSPTKGSSAFLIYYNDYASSSGLILKFSCILPSGRGNQGMGVRLARENPLVKGKHLMTGTNHSFCQRLALCVEWTWESLLGDVCSTQDFIDESEESDRLVLPVPRTRTGRKEEAPGGSGRESPSNV